MANKSGRVTFNVLLFDFCTDQASCMLQFENSPQLVNKFNWRLFSFELNLTEGFNDFIITPQVYLNKNSFISWTSDVGLIASHVSNRTNSDFILESSTTLLSFQNLSFPRQFSVVFCVEKLIKSYLYEVDNVYLDVGIFPVWVYLQNSFYQFVANMSVYDGKCLKYTRLLRINKFWLYVDLIEEAIEANCSNKTRINIKDSINCSIHVDLNYNYSVFLNNQSSDIDLASVGYTRGKNILLKLIFYLNEIEFVVSLSYKRNLSAVLWRLVSKRSDRNLSDKQQRLLFSNEYFSQRCRHRQTVWACCWQIWSA